MESKYLTLQTIFDLVKNDVTPTLSIVQSSEIIVRQNLPWDEIVKHLNELQSEDHIVIKQLSTAVVSITDKGLRYINSMHPGNAA